MLRCHVPFLSSAFARQGFELGGELHDHIIHQNIFADVDEQVGIDAQENQNDDKVVEPGIKIVLDPLPLTLQPPQVAVKDYLGLRRKEAINLFFQPFRKAKAKASAPAQLHDTLIKVEEEEKQTAENGQEAVVDADAGDAADSSGGEDSSKDKQEQFDDDESSRKRLVSLMLI